MPPNLSGLVTVGDETLEPPVWMSKVQYRKINQQICRGDVSVQPRAQGGDQAGQAGTGPKMADIVWSWSQVLGDILPLVRSLGLVQVHDT